MRGIVVMQRKTHALYSEVNSYEEKYAEFRCPEHSDGSNCTDQMEKFCDLVEQIIWENPFLLGPDSRHVHKAITRAAVRVRMAWGWDEKTIAKAIKYAYKVIHFELEDRNYKEDPELLKWWESLTDTEREEQMDRFRFGEVKWIPDAAEEVIEQKVRARWNSMTEAERQADIEALWMRKHAMVPEVIWRKVFWSVPFEVYQMEPASKPPLDVKPEWLMAVE
jgi:hypothetical protein